MVNKPGGGGSLAAAEVISSEPDGYKFMIHSHFFFAMTTKTQKVPFEPSDLIPIVNFIQVKNGFNIKGDFPWKTFNDLLDDAKKNPDKLTWSHGDRGTIAHMWEFVSI